MKSKAQVLRKYQYEHSKQDEQFTHLANTLIEFPSVPHPSDILISDFCTINMTQSLKVENIPTNFYHSMLPTQQQILISKSSHQQKPINNSDSLQIRNKTAGFYRKFYIPQNVQHKIIIPKNRFESAVGGLKSQVSTSDHGVEDQTENFQLRNQHEMFQSVQSRMLHNNGQRQSATQMFDFRKLKKTQNNTILGQTNGRNKTELKSLFPAVAQKMEEKVPDFNNLSSTQSINKIQMFSIPPSPSKQIINKPQSKGYSFSNGRINTFQQRSSSIGATLQSSQVPLILTLKTVESENVLEDIKQMTTRQRQQIIINKNNNLQQYQNDKNRQSEDQSPDFRDATLQTSPSKTPMSRLQPQWNFDLQAMHAQNQKISRAVTLECNAKAQQFSSLDSKNSNHISKRFKEGLKELLEAKRIIDEKYKNDIGQKKKFIVSFLNRNLQMQKYEQGQINSLMTVLGRSQPQIIKMYQTSMSLKHNLKTFINEDFVRVMDSKTQSQIKLEDDEELIISNQYVIQKQILKISMRKEGNQDILEYVPQSQNSIDLKNPETTQQNQVNIQIIHGGEESPFFQQEKVISPIMQKEGETITPPPLIPINNSHMSQTEVKQKIKIKKIKQHKFSYDKLSAMAQTKKEHDDFLQYILKPAPIDKYRQNLDCVKEERYQQQYQSLKRKDVDFNPFQTNFFKGVQSFNSNFKQKIKTFGSQGTFSFTHQKISS